MIEKPHTKNVKPCGKKSTIYVPQLIDHFHIYCSTFNLHCKATAKQQQKKKKIITANYYKQYQFCRCFESSTSLGFVAAL